MFAGGFGAKEQAVIWYPMTREDAFAKRKTQYMKEKVYVRAIENIMYSLPDETGLMQVEKVVDD